MLTEPNLRTLSIAEVNRMRFSSGLTSALLIGLISVKISAQDNGINPCAGEIREQEMAVQRAPGGSDGKAWLKLAVLRQNAGQYQQSERAYFSAIELLRPGDRAALADALDHMGTMYVECGEFSKAEPLEREALVIRESENDSLGAGISHTHLSVLLLGKRELSSAQAEAEMAVSLLVPEQTRPVAQAAATPEEKIAALIDLSLVRCAHAAYATAIPDLRRALRIANTSYTTDSIPVGFLHFLLGYTLWKSGDSGSAEELMKSGTQELATQLGWGHPMYRRALWQYRIFLAQAGRAAEADEIGAKIAKLEGTPPTARLDSAQVPMGLAQMH